MHKLILIFLLVVCLLPAQTAHVAADLPPDYPVANGHFYTQASGIAGSGFTVTDEAGIAFWSGFNRLGGVGVLGYPVSGRFICGGFVCQAVQKAVLQWQPASRSVVFLNTIDVLSMIGKDGWLEAYRQVPPSNDWAIDRGKSWPEIVNNHLALLNQNPSIKAAYANKIDLYGLPMAYKDMGDLYVVRAQRVIFQQWKKDVPWAKAGQVVIANGGAVALEAGLVPAEAAKPLSAALVGPPAAAGPVRLRIPVIGVNAAVETVGLASDGSIDVPKSPYNVAWWNNGINPGSKGNSVIVGHVDSAVVGAAVFWYLYKLVPGNEVIVVDAAGITHTFVVTEVTRYAWNDTRPIARYTSPTDQAQLTLITCTGVFDHATHNYLERLLVYTRLKN